MAADEDKRTYAEAAGSTRKPAGHGSDVGTEPENAADNQSRHPDEQKEGDEEGDEHSSYATATEGAETQEETDRTAAPGRGDDGAAEKKEEETVNQADGGSRRAKAQSSSTDMPSDANLAGLVHDKEEVDQADQAGSGPENPDSRGRCPKALQSTRES